MLHVPNIVLIIGNLVNQKTIHVLRLSLLAKLTHQISIIHVCPLQFNEARNSAMRGYLWQRWPPWESV